MGLFLLDFGEFLLKHYELIEAIRDAVDGGATKDEILKAIRSSMITASEVVVEAEIGPRPKP